MVNLLLLLLDCGFLKDMEFSVYFSGDDTYFFFPEVTPEYLLYLTFPCPVYSITHPLTYFLTHPLTQHTFIEHHYIRDPTLGYIHRDSNMV